MVISYGGGSVAIKWCIRFLWATVVGMCRLLLMARAAIVAPLMVACGVG